MKNMELLLTRFSLSYIMHLTIIYVVLNYKFDKMGCDP